MYHEKKSCDYNPMFYSSRSFSVVWAFATKRQRLRREQLVGGAVGAVGGALLGGGKGALIGAGVGALGGALANDALKKEEMRGFL
jgi:uncharacterized membrane protein